MGKVALNLMVTLNFLLAADVYETVFDGNCGFCHNLKDDSSGPLISEILKRYKAKYPQKEEFAKALKSWINRPSKDKALFPEAVKRYGLMPKVDLDEDSAEGVAEYLFKR